VADTTTTIDSQDDWRDGSPITGVIAYDPAGKIIPSVGLTEIAEMAVYGSLAVFARVRDGEGTDIANLGSGANGVLTPGSWAERTDDGRNNLTGGSITFPYHSSMIETDDEGKAYGQSGGMYIKLSSISAQVLMTRSGRFALGITAAGRPYLNWVYKGGTYTITAPEAYAVEVDVPCSISFSAHSGSARLKKDGKLVASVSGLEGASVTTTSALVCSCTGLWSDIYLFGGGTEGDGLCRGKYTGSWEKTFDLGEGISQTLRHLTITSKKKHNHSISVAVSYANRKAELAKTAVQFRFSVAQFEDEKFYPPETTYSAGRYMRIAVVLNGTDYDAQLPLVDKIVIVSRDFGDPTYTEETLGFDEWEEVLLPEEQSPEDLAGAIREINRLKAAVREIQRKTSSTGGIPSFPTGGGAQIENLIYDTDLIAAALAGEVELSEIGQGISVNQMAVYAFDMASDLTDVIFKIIAGTFVSADDGLSSAWAALINAAVDVSGPIATHAALITGVHGAVSPDPIAWASEGTGDVLLTTVGLIVAGLGQDGLIDVAIDTLIDAHDDESDAHIGVGKSITAHEASVGISGAHGGIEYLHANHKDASVNVHGVTGAEGAIYGYVQIADLITGYGYQTAAQVNTAADARIVYQIVATSGRTIYDAIEAHNASTGVHGSTGGVLVGKEAVDNHDDSATAHGSVESNFSGHKNDNTSVHGVDSVADGASVVSVINSLISTHADLTTGVHGLT